MVERSLHDHASELLEAYALDALEPEEVAIVDEHLDEGCEDCDENAGILGRVAQAIPLALPLMNAGAALKQRVLREALDGSLSSDGTAGRVGLIHSARLTALFAAPGRLWQSLRGRRRDP